MKYSDLQPQSVWKNFALLNAIPRGSKKEEKAAQFVADFGKQLGLEVLRDKIGNVIVKKPGQLGGEGKDPVILQAHVDMVHQKNNDTVFDFDTEGIRMKIEGEWLKAEGTTLGADNGIGVAYILSLLESTDLPHPPLEALFTIDEEAGMTGAKNLEAGILQGSRLLNIDTEDDEEITIGCAGGIDTNVTMDLTYEACPNKVQAFKLSVLGLSGGHSGMDIHLGKGNANKILFRILYHCQDKFNVRISSVDGGGLRNAIPREAVAILVVNKKEANSFRSWVNLLGIEIQLELMRADAGLKINLEDCSQPDQVLNLDIQQKIIRALHSLPNGVYRMSNEIDGLVETSSNLARVLIQDGKFISQSLQRSSVESGKSDVASAIRAAFEQIGAQVSHGGDYPGWKPNPDSQLLKHAVEVHQKVFSRQPKVMACHAGLETGIITGIYPGLDMISIGPTIRNPHSPDEKVKIQSVTDFWNYLTQLLATID